MRTVAHLSDLHFGRVDITALDAVLRAVSEAKPDVVVVSGDLTQRARPDEFQEARRFLDALPHPQIVVPGNHDVPLYNLPRRLIRPFSRYRRYITDNLEPFFCDDRIAVAGLNTARAVVFKGGRINREQAVAMHEKFARLDDSVIKIVVAHHPFDIPEGARKSALVGRAGMAMRTLLDAGADVFLTGHLHLSSTLHTSARYKAHGHSALLVQAGTATSIRGRGEPNSFNLIRVDTELISIECLTREAPSTSYITSKVERFRHAASGWVPA